ncbi:MAG: penicillin-binding protein 2 [Candidatus Nealsonbacteria bacterium]
MKQWRINFILIFIFLFGGYILSKLFFIQILNDDLYKALSRGQALYNIEETVLDSRGEIFFRGGEPLAINVEWPLVSISPRDIENREDAAIKLATILEIEEESLLEKMNGNDMYIILKKRISQKEVEEIKELNIKGVYLQKELGRYYPQEDLASQLVGFLNVEGVGQYGLEEYYDDVLRGERREPGKDIYLTIDYAVQFTAEQLLKEAKESLKIEGGEIVVMDPITGEIVAMATYPNFNPNNYSEVSDISIFQNSATQKIFEPGSIFKPITMAGALDMGVITPNTTYEDPGMIEIGKWPIYNYERRTYPGLITMTEVLEKSINTGAVFVERKLGDSNFLKYVEKFGFFEPTGIDLEETYSENKELRKGYEVSFATAAFGQGVEVTPLQLVKAFSAIANGGNLMKPYVISKIDEKETKPKVLENGVISGKASSQLTAMLVSVVENGYGKPTKIPGYYIGGKTGTAEMSWSSLGINKSGYSPDKTWQSFIGFAPAFNPQFVVLVKMNNPQTKTAESSAVPNFKKMMKYLIDYYQIAPDYQDGE